MNDAKKEGWMNEAWKDEWRIEDAAKKEGSMNECINEWSSY